ncbi:putative defense protein Hdd11 isoform X2 [Atheta coriaria]|uniref:putative defense protein Hdd11 isoform X2 n=1 Tax=Dalotia coriaria TaxID=877792 RepID=UPI0031F428E7
MKLTALVLTLCVAVHANSNGGSETCCVDMVPKHPVDAQSSPFAKTGYKVSVDKEKISDGGEAKITVSGERPFKGYLLQVRDGETAIGTFDIAANDGHSKTINCFTKEKNMATHNNANDKKSVSVTWKPPKGVKKTYTVYVTVAENGGVFWVRQPTAKITVE